MAQSAEDVCAEFARNFAALQIKYEELRMRFESSQETGRELTQRIQSQQKDIAHRDEEIAALKAERADLLTHRERAAKATVAVEHLRGRIESQQKAMEDRELEHKHEVDQVRAQLNDALTRVARGSDQAAITSMTTQKVEIEERCALMSGQLIEERERAAQAQLSAVATVRDLSSRNLELEQRVRSLDSEVSSLRSRVTKSSDHAAEASLERERTALENNALTSKIDVMTRELRAANARAEDAVALQEQRVNNEKARASRERDDAMRQLADANQRVSEMMGQRAQDADRIAALQRAAVAKLESARAELEADLEAATNARHAAMEDSQRLKATLVQERSEAEEARAQLRKAETRVATLQTSLNSVQAKLEAVAQNEAWLQTERDRFAAASDRQQGRAEELTSAVAALEARVADGERLALQLEDSRKDVAELEDARERDQATMQRLEEAYAAKVEVVKAELRTAKRRYTQAMQKEARQKKILLRALLEKEQALAGVPTAAGAELDAKLLDRAASVDAIALLKAQGEQARRFQQRIQELQDPSGTAADADGAQPAATAAAA